MRMAQGRWRQHAISAMMRFSRYGHFCGGRIAHRHWQHAIYHGFTAIWQTTYDSCFVKMCAGGAYGKAIRAGRIGMFSYHVCDRKIPGLTYGLSG